MLEELTMMFTDETGTKIGEQVVKDISDISEQYLGQLRSVNTTKAVKEEGFNKLQAKKDYNEAYDNLTNFFTGVLIVFM